MKKPSMNQRTISWLNGDLLVFNNDFNFDSYRKKHQEKVSNLTHEYEMKIQHALAKSQADTKLHTDLIEAQAQLDRALAQIQQLEKMSKSQFNIGETWEQQYRGVVLEMEELRDENASLKTKIRRQYKQIELLTRKNLNFDHFYIKFSRAIGFE